MINLALGKEMGSSCIKDAAYYYVTALTSCIGCLGANTRYEIRKRGGIKGNYYNDVAMHLFCAPCALTQESGEIQKLNKK